MSDQEQKLEEVFFQKEGLTEKQQNILVAATEAFAEKGFAATSTSEIAKRAGVAEGTIFRHYKTKKDLLFSIVSPMMVKLMAPIIISDLNKVLNHPYGCFEDFVRAMVKNRAEFLEKNLPTIRILIQEIPFHPELKDEFIKHIGQKVIKRFFKIIEHYQNEGKIIELPPMTVLRLVASTLIGYFVTKYVIVPTIWDDDEELEQTIQFLMRGLAKN